MAKVATPKTTVKKTPARSGEEQVSLLIRKTTHPLKEVMEEVRKLILGTNNEITEHIKWNAPSFCIDGDDRITFNLSKNDYLLLVFHRGAKVKDSKGKGPLFNDTSGLLEWLTNDRATIKISGTREMTSKKHLLKKVVKQWMDNTRIEPS
ncbi:MAG: DUF1801 domain-containing protein [Azospira oryzae]|jgi:hypothetical protein|nr:MAG: DUF1801 domain-containing protein [Azospira oryzae]